MNAAAGIDEHGLLRVDRGEFVKPEQWAHELTGWLARLLATDLELFQLRTSPLASDQFAVAAVKERSASSTMIRVGTGRAADAVAAVTKAVTNAVCDDGDVLNAALDRLENDGEVDAAALCLDGSPTTRDDERMQLLLEAFDEPGLLEVRTDKGEYGALRLASSQTALAVGMRQPSSRVREWLAAIWEGVGESPGAERKDGRT